MKNSVGKDLNVNMHGGRWKTPSGFDLGSTWDIILSKNFAVCVWGDKAEENLQKMVIMNSSDRIDFLKEFVKEEKVEQMQEEVQEAPADALTTTIRESLARIKEYSIGLYHDSCKDTHDKLKDVVAKKSVTELSEKDFIVLNAMDRVMIGNLSKYLNENGKASFTLCPECGIDDFTHTSMCSINIKTDDWLIDRNEGC
ncbi:MAG: hypothetical protein AABY15_02015 [Nanoarchaeota archaeon]